VTTNLTRNIFAPELFTLFDSTTNLGTHNSTYPVGAYVFTVQATTSNQTVTLNLPSGAQPNAPRVANYGAAQSVDASQPFTLSWDAWSDGTAADFIQVEVGSQFRTPDVFEAGALNGAATSVVIPAATLAAGQSYDASILFVRGTWTTNQPTYHTFVGRMTTTQFQLIARSGQVPTPITLTNAVAGPGTFSFEVVTSPGRVLTVEASTNLQPGSWTSLLTTNSTTGKVQFTDLEAVSFPARFYRATASN
jgi:hypothetical protein